MSVSCHFQCRLPAGMHARPASAVEEAARRFQSGITLVNGRNGCRASARSVLAMIAGDFRPGDPVELEAGGPDQDAALECISRLLQIELPPAETASPSAGRNEPMAAGLPLLLQKSSFQYLAGTPVSGGLARGKIVWLSPFTLPPGLMDQEPASTKIERQRVEAALEAVRDRLDRQLAELPPGTGAGIIHAHRAMLRDPEFQARLFQALAEGLNAARAVARVEEYFSRILLGSQSRLLQERVQDLQDLCRLLWREMHGERCTTGECKLTGPALVVAGQLTPGQFLAMDSALLRGLVLREGGITSHTAILARSSGIPAITGVLPFPGRELEGREALLDGELGLLAFDLDAFARRYYQLESNRLNRRRGRLQRAARAPGRTRGGDRLEVGANISTPAEALAAFAGGADSIGLFRTEMLFSGCSRPPDEETQLAWYEPVVKAAAGRPVTIRTLDAGGDKPLPWLELPREENPFLGCRGVRLYRQLEDLFRTQLRAVLRASAAGPVRVLIPMVACLEELRRVKQVLAEEQHGLRQRGIAMAEHIPLGIMVEVPAVAFALETYCREADFFSLGTNDLLQYFLAVERGHPGLTELTSPLQPPFLSLLHHIVETIRPSGRTVALCGEMAADPACLPFVAGLGLHEISVAVPAIAGVKQSLARLPARAGRRLLEAARNCATADEVRQLAADFRKQAGEPLLEKDSIRTSVPAGSKAEVLKMIADHLFVLGRTCSSWQIENAFWQRESLYTTGSGQGIAIPHCMCEAATIPSLLLFKLKKPVDWDSLDGRPVRLVLALAMPPGAESTHLRVLSRLARAIMHEEFRQFLLETEAKPELLRFLRERLDLEP